MNQGKGKVIQLEGNISSGKTTLSSLLCRSLVKDQGLSANVFKEQVNPAFLKALYADPKNWASKFQFYMMSTRLYQVEHSMRLAREGSVCLLDRGPAGDYVFALVNNQIGNLSEQDLDVYCDVFSQRLAESTPHTDTLVYLDVEPSECHRRMSLLRRDPAEEGVSLLYLEQVDSCYFHLLMQWLGGHREGASKGLSFGPAPRTIVIRWNAYGDEHAVLEQIMSDSKQELEAPVMFQAGKLNREGVRIVLDTTEEVEREYARLRAASDIQIGSRMKNGLRGGGDEKGAKGQKARTPSQEGPSLSVTPRLGHVAMNWDLEHTNAFKRVAMLVLADAQRKLVFYGRSLQKKSSK